MRNLLLAVVAVASACSAPLPDGQVVDDDALFRPASEVDARLAVACAGEAVGDGPIDVVIDDHSGVTLLHERDSGAVFLRGPFGVLPELCWWLTRAGSAPEPFPEDTPCSTQGKQDGTCDGTEDVPGSFEFRTPGVLRWDAPVGAPAPVDGAALLPAGGELARIDLTWSSYGLPGDETDTSYLSFLDPLPAPDGAEVTAAATAEQGVVLWDADAGDLYVVPRAAAAGGVGDAVRRGAPTGPGVLAAAGGYAAVGVDGAVWVYGDLDGDRKPSRDKRRHPALDDGVRDVAVHPGTGFAWALVADGVVGLPKKGDLTWHPTPGAEGLVLARPAGVPTVYAWGNVDGYGVIYRLQPDGVAAAFHLDRVLRGAGIGETFQELVLATVEEDGVHARSWIDQAHLAAIPPGTIGLALAPFVETPRDEQTLSIVDAESDAAEFGLCTDPPPDGVRKEDWVVCCIHAERAAFAAPQLEWLDMRLRDDWPGGPAAVVMGVVPSVWAPSTYCAGLGDPTLEAMGRSLPETIAPYLADWADRGVGANAVLLHNQPYDDPFAAYSSWLRCPDQLAEEADPSCWDYDRTADAQARFYQDLADAVAVAPWVGDEVPWTMLGGAFEGAAQPGLPAWVDIYPELELPDGGVSEDGLYFGLLAMDPRASGPASKELAPEDARARALGVPVGLPVSDWADGSGAAGAVYWPGATYALPWAYEIQASGLLFLDFNATAAESDQWLTDVYRGDEHSRFMTHADFAIELHYLTTRVLAHPDVLTPRWWYFHLQNVDRIREAAFHDGWITCDGDCWERTELDIFMEDLEPWAPQIAWSARPPG